MQDRERNVEKFCSNDRFQGFLGIGDLSLLFAYQFCNQRLFLHVAQKILYPPSVCNYESHKANSLIACLCSNALHST